MRILNYCLAFILATALALGLAGCDISPSTDSVDTANQEVMQAESKRQVGMPNIKNFSVKKQVKRIQDEVDRSDLLTYSYTKSEYTGKLVWFCDSVGYTVSSAVQFTNPSKVEMYSGVPVVIPQADPDGTFKPSSAEGSWVFCISPKGNPAPVYSEERITTFPWRRPES